MCQNNLCPQYILDISHYLFGIKITLFYYSSYQGVNINSKTSNGESGIVTLGPTGDINGWMKTSFNLEDHRGMCVGFRGDEFDSGGGW